MHRLNSLVKRWGLEDGGKDFSERVSNVKKMQDRVLSEPLIAKGAAFSFAIECGAFVLCHKTRRMERRRGMGGASVVDVLTQPVTIETETQKRSSHTLFGHPRAFRI